MYWRIGASFLFSFVYISFFDYSPALSPSGHNIAPLARSSSFAHDLPPLTRSLTIHSRLRYAHPLAHDSIATSLWSPACMIRSRARCARFSLIFRSRPRFQVLIIRLRSCLLGQAALRLVFVFSLVLCIYVFRSLARSLIIRSQHRFSRPLLIIRSRPPSAHPLPHHSLATSLRSPARS